MAAAAPYKTDRHGASFAVLNKIVVDDKFNVRKNATPDADFVESVKSNGVLNPVHVRYKGRDRTTLHLIDGERRFNAAKMAGQGSVPVINHGPIDDKESLVISLTANENQKRLTRKEQFSGFQRLKEAGLTEVQISKVMAVDKRTVIEALRVEAKGSRKLKAAASKPVKDGGVPVRAAARAAATLPKKTQNKIIPKMAGKNKTEATKVVRDAEKKIGVKRSGTKPATQAPRTNYKIAADTAERCEAIEKHLRKKLRHNQQHRVHNAQLIIIQCIKGEMTVEQLFGWEGV